MERGAGGQHFGRRKTQLCTLPISNPLWPRSRLFFTLINIAPARGGESTAAFAQISTARRKWANADHGTRQGQKILLSTTQSKEQEGIGKYCLRGHAEKLTGSAGRGISRAQGQRIRRGSKRRNTNWIEIGQILIKGFGRKVKSFSYIEKNPLVPKANGQILVQGTNPVTQICREYHAAMSK